MTSPGTEVTQRSSKAFSGLWRHTQVHYICRFEVLTHQSWFKTQLVRSWRVRTCITLVLALRLDHWGSRTMKQFVLDLVPHSKHAMWTANRKTCWLIIQSGSSQPQSRLGKTSTYHLPLQRGKCVLNKREYQEISHTRSRHTDCFWGPKKCYEAPLWRDAEGRWYSTETARE